MRPTIKANVGDNVYDESSTQPPLSYGKIDYVFFNKNRFLGIDTYGGDTVGNTYSDHKYLKASIQIFD